MYLGVHSIKKINEKIDSILFLKNAYIAYNMSIIILIKNMIIGLGFERLVCYTTGMENIREAIPFPRWPGHADY